VKAKHQRPAGMLKPLLIPKVEVGRDRYGLYFGVTKATHWLRFHLGCCRSSSGVRYLPLIEFAYNNSYQGTIGMPPYEALYE
jgi:hypothetical protein